MFNNNGRVQWAMYHENDCAVATNRRGVGKASFPGKDYSDPSGTMEVIMPYSQTHYKYNSCQF